jgi:hypothetical protein
MKRHPDQGCPGMKPRKSATVHTGGNGDTVDRLNADYLLVRNQQAKAKLKLYQLKLGEQERRLLPVAYVQALLGDSLVQLRQHMLSIPTRFRMQFRQIGAELAQQVGDWLRNDIDRALDRASEIRPALLSEDPFATWYAEDKNDHEKARTKQAHDAHAQRQDSLIITKSSRRLSNG